MNNRSSVRSDELPPSETALFHDPHLDKFTRSEPEPEVVDRAHAGLVIFVLAYCGGLVSMMSTIALPLLPQLPAQLHATVGDVSWISTAQLLAGAVGNPLLGRAGDLFGKRRVMLWALGSLVLGSVICSIPGSLLVLVVGRTFQGFGIGVIPLGISIARDELPEDKVSGGIALVSATLGIGGGIGLPVAGLLLQWFDWHSVFWLSTVLAVIGLVAAAIVIPESPVRTKGRFDVLGAAWLSLVLVSALLPLSKAPTWGWTGPVSLTLFGISFVSGVGWFRYVARARQPIVDLKVMRRRPVLLANATGLLLGFAMFSNFFAGMTLLQLPTASGHGFGAAIAIAGLVLLPGAIAMTVMSPVSARLTDAYGGRTSLLVGTLVVGIGFTVFPFLLGSLFGVGLGATIVNCGVGIAYGGLPSVIMANVPVSETASANAVNALARSGGASICSATAAAILGSLTVTVGGDVYASLGAFRLMLVLSAVAAFGAAVIASRLPKQTFEHA